MTELLLTAVTSWALYRLQHSKAKRGKCVQVAAYEFTTLTCIPGVVHYRGAKIQMLDLPGIIEGAKDGKGRGRQVWRNALLNTYGTRRSKRLLYIFAFAATGSIQTKVCIAGYVTDVVSRACTDSSQLSGSDSTRTATLHSLWQMCFKVAVARTVADVLLLMLRLTHGDMVGD